MEAVSRNRVSGTVVSLKVGREMASVRVSVDAGEVATAIAADSAKALGLKEGDRVTMVVSASEVLDGRRAGS